MPWYRGKILSLAGTKVNLLYVDYGQTEVGKVIFGQKESYLRVGYVKQLKKKKISLRFAFTFLHRKNPSAHPESLYSRCLLALEDNLNGVINRN
jgi:hypothetical protein